MKRDMDLIRELLLRLEALPKRPSDIMWFEPHDDELAVPGFSNDQIEYHLDQILSAGFIDNGNVRPMRGIGFRSLTPKGHDFLDSVRDPTTWDTTKKGALAVGGWTLDLIVEIAKGVIRKKIEVWTGGQL